MNDSSDNLDQLLSAWAHNHEPSAAHLAKLQTRILAGEVSQDHRVMRAETATRVLPYHYYLAAFVAACIMVVAMVAWRSPVPSVVPVSAPPLASRLPSAHLEVMLSEMDRLFEDRLVWVAETNQEVSLGLDESPSQRGRRIAVRVVVLKRSVGSESWQPVWTGDIAAQAEELVQLSSATETTRLNLWTHVLPDGAVAIDTELGLAGGEIAWSGSTVQQPEIPQQVHSARAQGTEFQVWQTAALLSEEAL